MVLGFSFFFSTVVTMIVCILKKLMEIQQNEDRRKRGECLNCGYDLRATPNRCPECGIEPDRATPLWERTSQGDALA